jgi:hypothetical protein
MDFVKVSGVVVTWRALVMVRGGARGCRGLTQGLDVAASLDDGNRWPLAEIIGPGSVGLSDDRLHVEVLHRTLDLLAPHHQQVRAVVSQCLQTRLLVLFQDAIEPRPRVSAK